jgi:hypothetical protein
MPGRSKTSSAADSRVLAVLFAIGSIAVAGCRTIVPYPIPPPPSECAGEMDVRWMSAALPDDLTRVELERVNRILESVAYCLMAEGRL